jgi:hypothetical protein
VTRLAVPLSTLLLALFSAPVSAQVEQCTAYARLVDAVVAGAPQAAVNLVDIGQAPRCFVEFLGKESAFRSVVRRFESSRGDRQAGATSTASGSTSIVAKGPAAKVLSVAAEYGALTQSTKDRIVTIRGNLAGLPSALVSHDVFPYCVDAAVNDFCVNGSLLSVLRKFSFGISFDPSRTETLAATPSAPAGAGAQAVAFTGSKNEVSALNIRAELFNSRDSTSQAFRDRWRSKVGTSMEAAATELLSAGQFAVDVTELPEYDGWRDRSRQAVEQAGQDRQRIVAAFTLALGELARLVRDMPKYEDRVAALQGAYNRFFLAQDDLIDALATANVFAVEFTHTRPVSQPATSNVRAILDYPFTAQTKVVANAAVTYYNSAPADPAAGGRLRDVQAAVELDRVLGASILGPAVFSVAGYLQLQRAAAILTIDPLNPLPGITFTGLPANATEVFTKTGTIWLTQAKLTLTPPGSSMSVPVSVTYSNRTELVDKRTWSGQVGVSYNVDALFAALSR